MHCFLHETIFGLVLFPCDNYEYEYANNVVVATFSDRCYGIPEGMVAGGRLNSTSETVSYSRWMCLQRVSLRIAAQLSDIFQYDGMFVDIDQPVAV